MTEIWVACVTGIFAILASIVNAVLTREHDRRLKELISIRKELGQEYGEEREAISRQIHYLLAKKNVPLEARRPGVSKGICGVGIFVSLAGIGYCVFRIHDFWNRLNAGDFLQWARESKIISENCSQDTTKCSAAEIEIMHKNTYSWIQASITQSAEVLFYGIAIIVLVICIGVLVKQWFTVETVADDYKKLEGRGNGEAESGEDAANESDKPTSAEKHSQSKSDLTEEKRSKKDSGKE